jgi:hypothetical protein
VLLSTGFISSTVALDKLYQQYGCSGQASSAVGLLSTGFISSTVALDRLYQQYGVMGRIHHQ